MSNHPKTLIVLSEKDRDDFLVEPLAAQLKDLLPQAVWLTPPFPNPNDWPLLLEKNDPEILITGWSTPRIPQEIVSKLNVRYICHLAGSVRNLIPRELIQKGALVTNWGNSISRTIAECALLLVL